MSLNPDWWAKLIARDQVAAERARVNLEATVVAAKLDGVTWDELADILGYSSRQGPRGRYGKAVDRAKKRRRVS